MKTIRIANNAENKNHLTNTGVSFLENGKYLVITPNDYHQQFLSSGQMTVASYKKNVLSL